MAFQTSNYTLQKKAAKDRALEAAKQRAFADSQANKNIGRNFLQGLLSTGTGLLGEYASGQMPWKVDERKDISALRGAQTGLAEAQTAGATGRESRAGETHKWDMARNRDKEEARELFVRMRAGEDPGQRRMDIPEFKPPQQAVEQDGPLKIDPQFQVTQPELGGVAPMSKAEATAREAFRTAHAKEIGQAAQASAQFGKRGYVEGDRAKVRTMDIDPTATGGVAGMLSERTDDAGLTKAALKRRRGSGRGGKRDKPVKFGDENIRAIHEQMRLNNTLGDYNDYIRKANEAKAAGDYGAAEGWNQSAQTLVDNARAEYRGDPGFGDGTYSTRTGRKAEDTLARQQESLEASANKAKAKIASLEKIARNRQNFRSEKDWRDFQYKLIQMQRSLSDKVTKRNYSKTRIESSLADVDSLQSQLANLENSYTRPQSVQPGSPVKQPGAKLTPRQAASKHGWTPADGDLGKWYDSQTPAKQALIDAEM